MIGISYKYRGIELNDESRFSVPLADLNLDDRNPVESSFAYRKNNIPVPTGTTIREGTIVLNLNISGRTPQEIEGNFNYAKQLFNTKDDTYYKLERKLPTEQYYKFLKVKVNDVTINRLERKVSITFSVPDREWQDGEWHEASMTVFAGASRKEYLVVNYDGLSPVEPIIELTPTTPGSAGPTPLYYRTTTCYTYSAEHIINSPILAVSGWNTSTEVSNGKMRADGLDITVTLPDGTNVPRYVNGTASSRKVWINPDRWPSWNTASIIIGPDAGNAAQFIAFKPGDVDLYLSFDGACDLPQSGKLMIDNEIIAYTSWQYFNKEKTIVWVTVPNRGQDGTSATDHYYFAPIKRPVELKINYGYASGYASAFSNDVLGSWYLINYETSTNATWVQDVANTSLNQPFSWRVDVENKDIRKYEQITVTPDGDVGRGTGVLAFHGGYRQGYTPIAPTRQRMSLRLPPKKGRLPQSISFNYEAKSTFGGGQSFTMRLYKTKDNYGVSGKESTVQLYTQSFNSGNNVASVGPVLLDSWYNYGTHLYWSLDAVPAGILDNKLFKIVSMTYQMDQEFNKVPYCTPISGEYGASGGSFPVYINVIYNHSAGGYWPPLSLSCLKGVGQLLKWDCAERTVEGFLLQETPYANSTWLVLVPGSNTIEIQGPQGAGQYTFKIKWQNKY